MSLGLNTMPPQAQIFELIDQSSTSLSSDQRRAIFETFIQSEWVLEKGKTENWLNNQLFRKLQNQSQKISLKPNPSMRLKQISHAEIQEHLSQADIDLSAFTSLDENLLLASNPSHHCLWIVYQKDQTLVYFAPKSSDHDQKVVHVKASKLDLSEVSDLNQSLLSTEILKMLSLLSLNETLEIQSNQVYHHGSETNHRSEITEILEIYHLFSHAEATTADDLSLHIQAQPIHLKLSAGDRLQVNEYLFSEQPKNQAISLSHWQIDLAENTNCDHKLLQAINHQQIHLHRIDLDLSKDAVYVGHQAQLGSALSRIEIQPKLRAEQATVDLKGLCIAMDQQEIDQCLDIQHLSAHTHSAQKYKSILSGAARAIFTGKVLVAKGAKQSSGDQNHASLMLSTQAKTYTRPQLEIYNHDVQCAHGATIAQIDEDSLFYLCSRGLSIDVAKQFLTTAFAMEIAQHFPQTQMQMLIQKQLCLALGVDQLFSISEELFDEDHD